MMPFICIAGLAFSGLAQTNQGTKTVQIRLKLQSDAAISINKAAFKYNKHTAFSFTLDDGYRSAFLCGYPLLNGGKISPPFTEEWGHDEGGDGSSSKGLYYSDGCGKPIAYKMAVAINGASLKQIPANRGNLSWAEVHTLYQSGWDILNHSYRHSTKHGTDYEDEVVQNNAIVTEKLGFHMTQFVVPGGESDPGYDMEYAKAAFKNGIRAVATTSGAGPAIDVSQPLNLDAMIYNRSFIKSEAGKGQEVIDQSLQNIQALTKKAEPIWYNQFSHGVGNTNLWGISLVFKDFKYYMTTLAKTHGIEGADDLWMAPWQEVYEYLWLRDRIQVKTRKKGLEVFIELSIPAIPDNFRYRSISLAVGTPSKFSIITGNKNLKINANGSGKHDLINIDLR